MKYRTHKQAGFVMLEAILAIVAAAAIVAAGYFAYQAHKNKAKTSGSNSTASVPAAKTNPTKPASEYDIKELGIKMTLPNGLSASDLTYQADTTSKVVSDINGKSLRVVATADFSTKSLIAAGGMADDGTQACLPSAGPFGEIQLLDSDPTGYSFGSGPELIKKVGSNFLAEVGTQSECSQKSQAIQLQTQQSQLLDDALKTALPL